MAEYFKRPFAEEGDKISIPADTQIDGSVSFQKGWTGLYSLDPASVPEAKRLEREKHNYIFNKITDNVKEWQEQTYPYWIADKGDGLPFSYAKNTIVKYTDGKSYISLIDTNDTIPTSTSWAESDFVNLTTDQTKDGILTLTSSPIVPISSASGEAVNFSQVIGIGQTWQNVGSVRSFGVNYQNIHDKPMRVSIGFLGGPGGSIIDISLDSVTKLRAVVTPSTVHNHIIQVDPGEVLFVSQKTSATLFSWFEKF